MFNDLHDYAKKIYQNYLEAVKRNGGHEGSTLCFYYLAQLDAIADLLEDKFNYTYVFERYYQ